MLQSDLKTHHTVTRYENDRKFVLYLKNGPYERTYIYRNKTMFKLQLLDEWNKIGSEVINSIDA